LIIGNHFYKFNKVKAKKAYSEYLLKTTSHNPYQKNNRNGIFIPPAIETPIPFEEFAEQAEFYDPTIPFILGSKFTEDEFQD